MYRGFIRPVLIGLLTGTAACLLLLFAMAAAATSFDIPISAVVPLATIAAAIGAFVGGFVAAKVSRKNGWLLGLLTAAVLFIVTMACGFAFFSELDPPFMTVKFAVMLACGMVGGMVAVNANKRRVR